MRRTRTRDTYCAHHGVNRGHNSAECMVISQEFAKYHDIIYEFLQTRGLGTNETGRGGRGHKSSRLHPSYGRGRGRGGGFGELPHNFPPNFPPDFPQDLPPGQFPYGPRHAFSASYPFYLRVFRLKITVASTQPIARRRACYVTTNMSYDYARDKRRANILLMCDTTAGTIACCSSVPKKSITFTRCRLIGVIQTRVLPNRK